MKTQESFYIYVAINDMTPEYSLFRSIWICYGENLLYRDALNVTHKDASYFLDVASQKLSNNNAFWYSHGNKDILIA